MGAGATRFLTLWSADGTRLYYDRQGTLVEVEVRQSPEGSIAPGEVVELFRFADRGINPEHLMVGADNSRFLVGGGGAANPAGATLPHNLVLIQNWAPGR